MTISLPREFFETNKWYKFNEPLLDFYPGSSLNINCPIIGIQQEGPFDFNIGQRKFDEIQFIVMSPDEIDYQRRINKIIETMRDRQRYFNGFKNEFRLKDVNYPEIQEYFLYQIDERRSIEDAVDEITKQIPSGFSRTSEVVPFVLVAGPDYRMLKDTPNYHTCKKALLEAGFPNQYLSKYISDNRRVRGILNQAYDQNLIYSLWNTMTSIYAKSGGIPWTLKNTLDGTIGPIDLVIGFRFAKNQELNGEQFIVGTASVFGCNGRWRGFYFSEFHDFREMKTIGLVIPQAHMEEFLANIIRSYRRWELSEKPKSVVIHKKGFFHENEINASLSMFNDYEIESYALLEVTSPRSIRLFDDQKRSKSIPRGLTRVVTDSSAILCSTGLKTYYWYRNQLKEEEFDLGSPKPLFININVQKDCFNTPIDSSMHIFSLTALHWQYLFRGQSSLPVTLDYAHEVAKHYARGVKPHDNLKSTPWFL